MGAADAGAEAAEGLGRLAACPGSAAAPSRKPVRKKVRRKDRRSSPPADACMAAIVATC